MLHKKNCDVNYLNYAGWLPVKRGTMVNFDLGNTLLGIKTDSASGSPDEIIVNFFNQHNVKAAGVKIFFRSPMEYSLADCSSHTNKIFPTTPTSDVNKVWSITLTKSTSADTRRITITVVIHCNEVEVLNVELSDTVCNSDLSANWNGDVTKMKFTSSDTASDFYKIYTPG